jgi:carboxypeptidase Q
MLDGMRRVLVPWIALFIGLTAHAAETGSPATSMPPEEMLRQIYSEALAHGQAFDHLRTLVANSPGQLSGSKSLERAVDWANETLTALHLDRVYQQDVMVPHWERGERETVLMVSGAGAEPLSAVALGGSGPTSGTGLVAEVTEVHSLDELVTLGRNKIEGRIIFFNRPMDPTVVNPGPAYGGAGDQRNRGPGEAAKYGAVGALVRSLTHAHDDIPHTGVTVYPPGGAKIPAAALSTVAADKLSAALTAAATDGGNVRVALKINSRWLEPALSHNVIGEIRGTEFPEQIILVGGHLDSWDIAPGAHDDGAGVVQSIEVLRLFRALGVRPRHTIRCVLFVNEENGLAGATEYASVAKTSAEKHIFAVESDNGGFQPHGFSLGSTQGDVAERASRWLPLFKPYGIFDIRKGNAGTDVTPLLVQGVAVGELTPDSQRYFDLHHTTADSIDKVNPRELHLGAAALASLIWLVDTQGF